MFNESILTLTADQLKEDAKTTKPTENSLKARTMIIKREWCCKELKRKFENINEHKHKQMRNSRQNDKLEQWVMHTAVKDEVLGSILGSNKQKNFFHL